MLDFLYYIRDCELFHIVKTTITENKMVQRIYRGISPLFSHFRKKHHQDWWDATSCLIKLERRSSDSLYCCHIVARNDISLLIIDDCPPHNTLIFHWLLIKLFLFRAVGASRETWNFHPSPDIIIAAKARQLVFKTAVTCSFN